MSQFFLTLPSNSSLNFFPDNTSTKFSTKLSKKIVLEGNWEVGLSEIILPHSWYNIDQDDYLIVHCSSNSATTIPPQVITITSMLPYTKRITFQPGYYSSKLRFIEQINMAIENSFDEGIAEWYDLRGNPNVKGTLIERQYYPKLVYNEVKKKVTFVIGGKMTLTFSQNLADVLGLHKPEIRNDTRDQKVLIKADYFANINVGRNIIFVYCDILEHVPVGDVMSPLLRIVDVEMIGSKQDKDVVLRRTFDRPLYVPLRICDFDTIEINLRDEYGRPIPFGLGRSFVTLHFRQSKESNYFT